MVLIKNLIFHLISQEIIPNKAFHTLEIQIYHILGKELLQFTTRENQAICWIKITTCKMHNLSTQTTPMKVKMIFLKTK